MLMVYKRCQHFIRTIPDLVVDERTMEDIDSDGEDHVYDETCNLCMARPIAIKEKSIYESDVDKRIAELEKGVGDNYDMYANTIDVETGGLYGGIQ